MGYTYYQSMVLIPPDNPLVFADVVEMMRQRFSRLSVPCQITVEGNKLILQHDSWSLRLYWEQSADVGTESQEIARLFAVARADQEKFASCDCRLTTAGDDDPNMDFFNDYAFVLEILNKLVDVYRFDPYDGKFVNEFGEV